MSSGAAMERRAHELADKVAVLRREVHKVIIGQDALVDDLLVALLAGGHVLLEGLPGLGKTLLVHTVAEVLGVSFGRIQFTPDLMPTDITGTRIVTDTQGQRGFEFQPGPLFKNLVLADEINRATPKTQSALLEAMQEGSVTVGHDSHPLEPPFWVVATQNPIELEGTYPLPEAQLDRFLFKLEVAPPGVDDLTRILQATTSGPSPQLARILTGQEVLEIQALSRQLACGPHLLELVAHLVHQTHPEHSAHEATRRLVRFGASPRAAQAIILSAKVRALIDRRPCVARADIESSLLPALRHRVMLGYEAEHEGVGTEKLIPDWLAQAEQRRG